MVTSLKHVPFTSKLRMLELSVVEIEDTAWGRDDGNGVARRWLCHVHTSTLCSTIGYQAHKTQAESAVS